MANDNTGNQKFFIMPFVVVYYLNSDTEIVEGLMLIYKSKVNETFYTRKQFDIYINERHGVRS